MGRMIVGEPNDASDQRQPAELLAKAASTTDPEDRSLALVDLADRLTADLFGQALDLACEIADEFYRDVAIAGLAPHLPETHLDRALDATLAVTHEHGRNLALPALAPRLSDPLLHRALGAVAEVTAEATRSQLLAELVPHLPDSLHDQVLEIAATAPTQMRLWVLSSLASHVQADRVEQVLSTAGTLTDEYLSGELIAALAPQLPESKVGYAWELASALTDPDERDRAMAGLIPRLPHGHLDAATVAADALVAELFESAALYALLPRLPEPQRREQIKLALAAAIESFTAVDSEWGHDVMTAAVDHLPDDLLEHTFASVIAIPDSGDRATALNVLARRLPVDLFDEAMRLTRQIGDLELQEWATAQLLAARAEAIALPDNGGDSR